MNQHRKPLLDAKKVAAIGSSVGKEQLEYYVPPSIPPEVSAYGSELDQLGVGKAGKLGALFLRLEEEPETGKTSVKEQYSRVPLFAQRALYLEEALPRMAYLYIISPSGGILQGDRYRMDIILRNSAFAHVTTQGATRLYRMEKNFATQVVNIDVGEGCYFEYIPDQIIPYRNSRFYQVANLRVHDAATLVYSEMVTPGRVASGEHFDYDICYMKATAKNQKDQLRLHDVAILEPKKRKMQMPGILDNFDMFGSVYILAQGKYVAELSEKINHALAEKSTLLDGGKAVGGASLLPGKGGVVVRLLGNNAAEMREIIFGVVRIVRKVILDAPFSGIRKG